MSLYDQTIAISQSSKIVYYTRTAVILINHKYSFPLAGKTMCVQNFPIRKQIRTSRKQNFSIEAPLSRTPRSEVIVPDSILPICFWER